MKRLLCSWTLVALLPVALAADVLVMRDGTRVQGELVSVRNGVVEFEERSGRGRTIRVDREEVARIELDRVASDDRDFAGNTGGRPSGLRERTVTVSADVTCNDTGIDVRSNQQVFFEATGNVRWGPNRRHSPAGENNSPNNPNRPMPNRPAAALIGRVGENSNAYFFIGDDTAGVRMRGNGRLYLCVNDDVLTDNTGNFRVVVHY